MTHAAPQWRRRDLKCGRAGPQVPGSLDPRLCPNQAIAGAVQRLKVEFLNRFHAGEPHAAAHGSFGDGLGVFKVILARFAKRCSRLRRNEPHFVTQRLDPGCQKLRAGARFHGDQATLQLRDKFPKSVTSKLATINLLPSQIHDDLPDSKEAENFRFH